MDKKKMLEEAKSRISELSKRQDEIYSSLLSDLELKEEGHLADYVFDYCFNDCDCDFNFEEL
jgi:hypothetical protein